MTNFHGLLTQNGSYYLVGMDLPTSKYEGLVLHDLINNKLCMSFHGVGYGVAAKEIRATPNEILRVFPNFREHTTMPLPGVLQIELSRPQSFSVLCDFRVLEDLREWGRGYELERHGPVIFVHGIKRNDSREIVGNEYDIHLAILTNGRVLINPQWKNIEYWRDQVRNSPPSSRYVYSPFSVHASRIMVVMGESRESVANQVFKWSKAPMPNSHLQSHQSVLRNSLLALEQKILKLGNSLLAGLPWFYQSWARDSLVSARALMLLNRPAFALNLLHIWGKRVSVKGTLPVFEGAKTETFDSVGWLWKRLEDYLIQNYPITKAHHAELKVLIKTHLNAVLQFQCRDHLIYSGSKESWMDTEISGEGREGFCIEHQALLQSMFRVYSKLWGVTHREEREFRKAVNIFVRDGIIDDVCFKSAVRPNIFIAAYLSPELFNNSIWEKTFDSILPKLWLSWGGLSSIDQSDPLFCAYATGEDPRSYHRGDSWFWVNNLAAIVLHRMNKVKYSQYIQTIHRASLHELRHMGALGFHAEISSAAELRSEGCLAQAWSAAMLIELVHELQR